MTARPVRADPILPIYLPSFDLAAREHALIRAFQAVPWRTRRMVLFANPDDAARARSDHPEMDVIDGAANSARAVADVFRRFKPAALLCFGSESLLNSDLTNEAGRRPCPVILWIPKAEFADDGTPLSSLGSEQVGKADLILVEGEPNRDRILEHGLVPSERLVAISTGQDPADAIEVVHRFIREWREAHPHSARSPLRRLKKRFRSSRPVVSLVSLNTNRIESLEALRHRLDDPETILCLGSGPSAEDPRLQGIDYDALFRVNLRWVHRGVFDDPDVIFTWRAEALRVMPQSILAYRTKASIERAFAYRVPFHLSTPVTYFLLEEMSLPFRQTGGLFEPTMGTNMLATAVALGASRIIIAGIDLYLHPSGAYPGDPSTGNAYTFPHSRDSEIGYIESALAGYGGDLVILSDVLAEHLRARGRITRFRTDLPAIAA